MDESSIFDLSKQIDCPIIIYGASAYGEIAYQSLVQNGFDPYCFCDRKAIGGAIGGLKVIRPEQVANYRDAVFIIASADAYLEIKSFLQKCGCKNIYDMRSLLDAPLDVSNLSNRAKDTYDNRQNYFDAVNQSDESAIYFSRLQFVVSERCSLRCKNCSHLMQYYKQPQNVDLDMYKPAFDRFLDVVDKIAELRIMGGEPFMNQDVYKLIEWYYSNPKIQRISIYTNGTIIPNEKNLKVLSERRIRLHISDYGCNKARIDKVKYKLDEYEIPYFLRQYESWQETGNLKKRGYDEEKLRQNFSSCFERNSYTFLHGKLYHCPRSAHGMNFGAIPWEEDDCVDFASTGMSREDLRSAVIQLCERGFLRSCDYCDGPNFHEGNIPAGEQIDHPLDF